MPVRIFQQGSEIIRNEFSSISKIRCGDACQKVLKSKKKFTEQNKIKANDKVKTNCLKKYLRNQIFDEPKF